jgi:mRNA interferase RelE/StbE
MVDVLLSERARDRLDDLDAEPRERITNALRELTPDRDLARLSGEDAYRLRVGDYRVIVDWDKSEGTVYVLTLGHRRNIYDREF